MTLRQHLAVWGATLYVAGNWLLHGWEIIACLREGGKTVEL